MSGLISRKAVLDIIGNLPPEEIARTWAYVSVSQLPSVDEWVPCSERLPKDVEIGEEYPTVIFCTKDAVYVGFYEYYLDGKWWAAEEYTVDNVIAWMPLPEPYKGR